MTNFDDIYLRKDNTIIQLRIIFGEDYDMSAIEYEYNGKVFTNPRDVEDFDLRYHFLKDAGYEEVQMYTSYNYDASGNKIINYNFE